jgi:hydrogenase maturation protease
VLTNGTKRKKKIIVLGLGNEVLGDESLGLVVVREISEEGLFPEIDFACLSTGGLNLLDYIDGYDSLLLIDTACGNNYEPGTITHYNPGNFRETLHLSSEHDVSFSVALETGKRLGLKIPKRIHIIAIEISCDLNLSQNLSDNISAQFDKIRSEIIKFIEIYIADSL